MRELFFDLPEAIENTQKLAEICNLEILINQRYFPKVEIPAGFMADEYLKKITREKALPLYGKNGSVPAEIEERINYNWTLFAKKALPIIF